LKFLALILTSLVLFTSLAHGQEYCAFIFQPSLKFRPSQSWGRQAFEFEFQRLENFFASTKNMPEEKRIQLMIKMDIRRRDLFQLQALSRLMTPQNKKFFAKQRLIFKDWEGTVSELDLSTALRETAEAIGEPSLVTHFQNREKAAIRAIVADLKDAGLWDRPKETLNELREKFKEKGDWLKGREEKQFLIESLTKYAENLNKKIKAREFDDADIELGYHKLRRGLRWVLVQATALNGLIELSHDKNISSSVDTWFSELKQTDRKLFKGKFMKIAEPVVSEPLQIPREEFAIINHLVNEIGITKDIAEQQILFTEALKEMGASDADIARVMTKLNAHFNSPVVDHQALSVDLQEKIEKTKLLHRYIEALQRMN